MQHSFSTLWDGFASDAEAKAARDKKYHELKKADVRCRRWVLKNQLRKYNGLGSPNGQSCDVYMIDVNNGT